MNVPVPLIVSFLSIIFAVLSAAVGLLIRVVIQNTTAINEIKLYIATQKTADVYEEKSCVSRHNSLSKTIKDFDCRLKKLES
jgi:cbb3-type cytochrome oxidase cytochrome c subunit